MEDPAREREKRELNTSGMPRIFDREINSESLTDRVLTVNEGELEQSFETNSCKILPERTSSNTYRISTQISKRRRDHRIKGQLLGHACTITSIPRQESDLQHTQLDWEIGLIEMCPLHTTRVLVPVQNKCPLFRGVTYQKVCIYSETT